MSGPLLWLAGADRDALRRCGEAQRSERARLAALVVIPAVLGFASMSYAVSTVAPRPQVYFGVGACWSLVVLVIDRYLVVSTRRMPLSGQRRRLSAAVVARYVFAIFVGVAVAHPFSLLWFNDSIVSSSTPTRAPRSPPGSTRLVPTGRTSSGRCPLPVAGVARAPSGPCGVQGVPHVAAAV